jgi:hypothetical protein
VWGGVFFVLFGKGIREGKNIAKWPQNQASSGFLKEDDE